jgi:ACS family sodium-dependent inorganic phosphate cotransporter
VFATTLSGQILHHSSVGWPAVFYVFGTFGVVWFLLWIFLCYNNPREHPFISEEEAKYLDERMSEHTHKKPPPVPWRHILRSAPLWALIAAQIGHDWGFFTMVTDLPKYMSSVLKFSIQDNGYYSSLPYLCMWFCSVLTSWGADWLIIRGYLSTTNVRKLGTTIASVGPGLFIIAASYAGCDQMAVVILFTIGMTLMGTFYPGERPRRFLKYFKLDCGHAVKSAHAGRFLGGRDRRTANTNIRKLFMTPEFSFSRSLLLERHAES